MSKESRVEKVVGEFRGWYRKILERPVTISLVVFALSLTGVVAISFRYYSQEFCRNVLVEAHGMLFDILVIGVFILWLNQRAEKRRTIQRYNEELDDYRGWPSEQGARRTAGIIKRLNKLDSTKLNLSGCYLRGAVLRKADLQRADLWGADLWGADLREADLREAKLGEAKLGEAKLGEAYLGGVDLREADLRIADLRGAYLRAANLQGANLQGADLQGANFRVADLRRAKDLTIEQLSQVKTLYEALGLAPELMEIIKTEYPHLLEKPKLENEALLRVADLRGSKRLTIELLSEARTQYKRYKAEGLTPELMEMIKREYPHLLEKPKEEE